MTPVLTNEELLALTDEDYAAIGLTRAEMAAVRLPEESARLDLETPPFIYGDPLHKYQLDVWDSSAQIIAICAGWQSGKALDVTTPIPTPTGFVAMGDIEVGQQVIGRDGNACNVIGRSVIYEVETCYRIRFCDGTEIVTDGEHQWFAESWRQRRNRQRDEKLGKLPVGSHLAYGQVVTTKQMAECVTGPDGGAEWSVPLPSPVAYAEISVPIPPYALGAWLGDGHSRCAYITTEDADVLRHLSDLGIDCTPINSQNAGNALTYKLGGSVQGKAFAGPGCGSIFRLALGKLGLIRNKHIPECYKIGSIEQRLELIRGMLDTDGFCDPEGHVEYCSINETLANDFAEVVRSLGIKCRVRASDAVLRGVACGTRYRVSLFPRDRVFCIERKAQRQKNPTRPDVFARYIRSIEKVNGRQVRCISVDAPDELYIAGRDYHVTHNTVALPHWLKREIQRRGPGDYGAFSSTYKLLERKFLPELRRVFADVADFRSGMQQFIFTEKGNRAVHGPSWNGEPTIIQLGHAENPDSLESATLKGVAWDECGQRLVPKQSWDTVRSRVMVNRGRICLASKPYESGWFEELVGSKNPNVQVVSFPSWANPRNPPEEDEYWDEIRSDMPLWRFVMQYEGRFTMPAGLIYDCFEWEHNTCEDFEIDRVSLLYPAMDFGKVNTAGLAMAEQGDTIYVIGEYHAGQKRDYPEHVASMKMLTLKDAQGRGYQPGCGGNKHGEDGWREAYRRNGLPLDEPPEPNIEVQIQAVYSLMKQRRIKFFRNGARETIRDVQHFSRQVDEDGNVTDKIQDESVWHRLAALRYGISKLASPSKKKKGHVY